MNEVDWDRSMRAPSFATAGNEIVNPIISLFLFFLAPLSSSFSSFCLCSMVQIKLIRYCADCAAVVRLVHMPASESVLLERTSQGVFVQSPVQDEGAWNNATRKVFDTMQCIEHTHVGSMLYVDA